MVSCFQRTLTHVTPTPVKMEEVVSNLILDHTAAAACLDFLVITVKVSPTFINGVSPQG